MENNEFKQSQIDECMFYRGSTIVLQSIDDLLVFEKYDTKNDQNITDLKQVFDIDNMGRVTDFLGVEIEQKQNKSKLTQLRLFESVINHIIPHQNIALNSLPSFTPRLLHPEQGQDAHNKNMFHYKSILLEISIT